MVEIEIYLFYTSDAKYGDLSAYNWPYTENISQSVKYFDEIRRVSFFDNNVQRS